MNNMYQIGVDEAGRGPMIGPLVVVAVAVPSKDLKLLEELKITDSKKLNKKKREATFEKINDFCNKGSWKKEVVICNPIEIDFAMETTNLNTLETELFAKSVNKLNIDSLESGKLILDACDVNEKRFGNRVTNLIHKWNSNKWELISKHRADESFRVVGAASIIAKVTRDNIIEGLEKELGIEIGSGYPSDPKSKLALSELCKGNLPNEYLRWNWSTTRKYWIETKGENPPIRNYKFLEKYNTSQLRLDNY